MADKTPKLGQSVQAPLTLLQLISREFENSGFINLDPETAAEILLSKLDTAGYQIVRKGHP